MCRSIGSEHITGTINKNLETFDNVRFNSFLFIYNICYRAIQKNFVDMENMFELLREEQEVIDAPGARSIDVKRGQVEFANVSFGYSSDKVVLKNVSFTVPAGKTVALVGPSGAGKSTIMRLLFRFYDVEQGAILIDGQNVKTVTQESLRNAIGIATLPDDVLFDRYRSA